MTAFADRWLEGYAVDNESGDFVWDSMLQYWGSTGQLSGLPSSSVDLDQGDMNHFGWMASYGTAAPRTVSVGDGTPSPGEVAGFAVAHPWGGNGPAWMTPDRVGMAQDAGEAFGGFV